MNKKIRPFFLAGALGILALFRAFADAPKPPFDIPDKFGIISKYEPAGQPNPRQTVVLIQDLHANVGVQKNIASILYRLRNQNKSDLLLVCVEGASGEGDVSLLRSLPGPVRHEFEDMLLHKAYLTGAELSATEAAAEWPQQQSVLWYRLKSFFSSDPQPGPVSLSPILLWGVDDPDLYRTNWHAAKNVDRQSKDALTYMRSIESTLMPGAAVPMQEHLHLLVHLLMLQLQPVEYKKYLETRSLNPRGPAQFEATVMDAEAYYAAAQKRSVAMANNLLKRMGSQAGVTALVTGGFHTQEIADILQTRGVPYLVVTPRVEVLDQDAAYKARLREEE